MTGRHRSPLREDEIADAARAWLGLLYAGDPTDADRARFETWLNAAPAHREAFARAESVWSSLGLSAHVADWVNEPISTRAIEKPARRPRWPALLGTAAAAAILVVLAAPYVTAMLQPPQTEHHVAGVGENKTVALEDGTVLTLSASSAVDVRYTRAARQIDLVRGSAYFEVAHDEARPLMVDAAGVEVLVLGTAFGVRLGPSDVRVNVSRGRVSVAEDQGDRVGLHRMLTTIGAGRQVVADLQGRIISESDADLGVALAWMEGQLIYDGATLADAVSDINRYRVKQLEIADPALASLQVTASFRVDQAERFIAGLPAAYPVAIRELPDRTRIEAR